MNRRRIGPESKPSALADEGAATNLAKRDDASDAKRADLGDRERDHLRDESRDRRRDESDENTTSSFTHDVRLIVAMAEECAARIEAWNKPTLQQPSSLQLKHLEWMCRQVAEQSDIWPRTKLHRWLGFIQAGMIANRLLRLGGAKRMFDEAKKAHPAVDQDLLDHLNPDDSFELDLGGQG